MNEKITEDYSSSHWADHVAEELIAHHPHDEELVCASGISPSGVVHIGNFREVITVDLVVRALRERGKKVRFLYSWDDYDALRKIPANLPEQKMIEESLRKPISLVPDPFYDCASYAAHFEKQFEREIGELGIFPEFIYQNIPYQNGEYRDGILKALEFEEEIKEILNRFRTEPLSDDWTCLSIFCKQCHRDTTENIQLTGGESFTYFCRSCSKDFDVKINEGGVKLLWRVDWPMRWAREKVHFEPGGKDHSSRGGSYETGAEIIRKVWKREPPHYIQYDFVLAKGLGSKLSSSTGNLITLSEALEIYEPEVIRWIFASRKPNLDFSIAFDLDVMKAYDDFDRSERVALKMDPAEEKKFSYEKRIFELSTLKGGRISPGIVAQFPFRHLCNILQIHRGDLEKTKSFFNPPTPQDEIKFYSRAKRAWNWITTYAPEEFKFQIRRDTPPKTKCKGAVQGLISLMSDPKFQTLKEEEVATRVYDIIKKESLEPRAFFQEIYQLLISKPNGPKLSAFLRSADSKRVIELLKETL